MIPAVRRHPACRIALALALLTAITAPCLATTGRSASDRLVDAQERFDRAVAIRDHHSPDAQHLYADSLELFESVIHDGIENGHLYYNAANAALRIGRIGQAIAYYRQAERLLPNDNDVSRNLAYARSLCEMRIAAQPSREIIDTLLFWHRDTTTRSRMFVAAGTFAIVWILLAARWQPRRRSAALTWTTVVVAAVAIATGASVAYDISDYGRGRAGVVAMADTVLRKGNGEGYQPQLDRPLTDGVEFDVLERRDSFGGDRWLRVRLRDGTDGWLNAERAIVF